MAGCILDTTYSLSCDRTTPGGIKNVWFGQWNGTTLQYTLTGANSDIIGTFSSGTVSFYKLEQEFEKSAVTITPTINEESLSPRNEVKVELFFQKMDSTLRTLLNQLIKGRYRVLFQDQNDLYWLANPVSPGRISGGTIGWGKSLSDLNGATLEFSAAEPNLPLLVSQYAVNQVVTSL